MPCVRSYGERSQTLQDPRTRDLTGPLIGLILVAQRSRRAGTSCPLSTAVRVTNAVPLYHQNYAALDFYRIG